MNRASLALGSAIASLGLAAFIHPAAAQAVAPPTPVQPEQIVVTATRRAENVDKIPYSISAITGATLQRDGITDVAGLRNAVVGLQAANYGDRGASVNNNFIIRGINTQDIGVGQSEFPDLAGATVSNYIDDTPLFINLKLTDIQRVEILRGPQGTLFGADSVGGTVRTIHNKPDPAGFDYRLDGTISGTDHASQPNSASNIMLNIPLTDRLAVRFNAGYDREAGYINADNAVVFSPKGNLPYSAQPVLADPADPITSPFVTTTNHGINNSEVWFARGDVLWKPTSTFSIETSYQHQNDTSNGFNFEYPGTDYVSHRRIPINPSKTNTDIGAVTLTADFGFGTVTSSSSYYNVGTNDLYDNSGIDVELPYYYGSYPRITTPNYDHNTDHAFTQEVRLVSPKGRYFDYVVGAFYQNRQTDADSVETVPGFASWANLSGTGPTGYDSWADYLTNYYGGTRPGSLNPSDLVYDFNRSVHFTDLAGFGEGTIHLTPEWNIIGGVRVFTEDFQQTTVQHLYNSGTTFGADSLGTSAGSGSKRSQDQIFKASTSYQINPRALAYFVFSQGYRAGGANAYPIGTCNFCNSNAFEAFGPDNVNNYEVGLKGSAGKLRYSVALYDMEWQNIQLEVTSTAGTPIIINGNGARSRGLELEGHYNLNDEITLTGGYAYTDAVLTQNYAVADGYSGSTGSTLPGVSHNQLNFAADYAPEALANHAVLLHIDGFWRSGFSNQIERNEIGYHHLSGFSLFNAEVQTDITPKVQLQLFAQNLFNAKGVTAESELAPGGPSPDTYALAHSFEPAEFVNQPLTVGLRIVIRH
jgi:iron complex outermembrane receptor protein